MNTYPDLKLSRVLTALIKERGLTITSLSRLTNVPIQTLHGWLQGNEPKSIKQVKMIADLFKVDLDYLCFEVEETKANFTEYSNEINTGVFEVILRRVNK